MEILLGFSPWVLYWALTIRQSIVLAGIVSLALALIVNLRSFWKHRPKILEMGALVFLAAATIAALFIQSAIFVHWWRVFENAALFLLLLTSIAVKRPVILQYVKEEIPEEKRDSPQVYRICLRITWVWTVMFFTMMLSGMTAAIYRQPMTWPIWTIHTVFFVGTMTFTRLYKKKAR